MAEPHRSEPIHGRLRQFSREGLVFDVLDRGPFGESGSPLTPGAAVVVLLHGFPQRATSWDAVSERLHAAGLRTVAPDQRGYSPRARPTRRRDYRVDRLADDIGALLDTLALRGVEEVHLVGHDWGAAVAWLVAAQHPAVRTLTSISVPHPAAFLSSMRGRDQLRRSWYVGFFQLPWLPERAAARGRFADHLRGSGMSDAEIETVERTVVDAGALRGALGWYRAIGISLPRARRLWRQRVEVPVTHVWSDGDVALGPRTAAIAHRWAGADFELVTVPGASHWLPEQEPELLANLILERVRGHRS